MRFITVGICLGLALTGCKSGSSESNQSAATDNPNAATKASAQANTAPSAPAMPDEPPPIPAPADVAAPPATAEKTASGLASVVLTKGTGTDHPRKQDRVKVRYTGWTPKDGKMFDSSVNAPEPTMFPVGAVIPGWTELLELMVVGEKRRAWIPSELAYGDPPKRPGAPAGALTFDVELIDIIKMPDPPSVPEDVKEAPKTAKKTASGLAYRVLKPGTGDKPKATDVVVVHYSGWTTDGKMFDSSVVRGQPASFALNQVIPGWTEGVQLMKTGEKTRFWIPGKLAYGDTPTRPGAPSGMLVFDVELLQIAGHPSPAASASAK